MPPKRSRPVKSKAIVIEQNVNGVVTPLLHFSHPDNATWHKERQHYKIIVEKLLAEDVEDYSECRPIRDLFDVFGWRALFDLPDSVYGNLVHEFYANIEDKSNTEGVIVRTQVQNLSIVLTSDVLSDILGVDRAGGFFDLTIDKMSEDETFDLDVAYSHFNLQRVQSKSIKPGPVYMKGRRVRNRFKYPATGLDAQNRVVLYLLHNNVVPAIHESGVRQRDIYLLYRMCVGLDGLSKPALAPIILQCMRRVANDKIHAFLYPRLLTKVFIHFGIPLASHMSQDCSREVLTLAGVLRLGIKLGAFDKPNRFQPQQGTSEVPHPNSTWQEWALHFDARLNQQESMLQRQEDLLQQILQRLGEPAGGGSPASPPS